MPPRTRILEEVAALRSLDVPRLVERYEALFGRSPRVKHKDWLWKRIAWKLEEQRLGGLSAVARARLEELIAEIDLPLGERASPPPPRPSPPAPESPTPGTILTRVWHAREIRVRALESGFEWEGTNYRSLSAVARAVTGAHWNGRLFFGLTKRSRPR